MGSLSHLTGGMDRIGMDRIKEKLAQADSMGLNLSDLLGKKFEQVNTSLEKNLKTLVEQSSQSQSRAFQNAVQDAVLNITRIQQIMLNSNMGVLKVSFTVLENRISALEDIFKKRVHVFEIERKNDQISKVTVKVK